MKRREAIIFAVIILLAVASRFVLLGTRPIHHDEGMLSYFAWQLAEGRGYAYTPQIHGPILFYLQAIVFKFFGTGDAMARASMAVFGVILVGLPLAFYKKLGIRRAIAISILALTSPLLIYFSRFLVHTGLVIVPNFLAVVSLWLLFRQRRLAYLYLFSISLALAFGISEASYIFLGVLALFVPFYLLFDRKAFLETWEKFKIFARKSRLDLICALLVFILAWILIYSVGLTNPKSFLLSLPNPFNADGGLGFWLSQHKNKLGGQPWFYYLILFVVYEPLVLIGGILAAVESFVMRRGGTLQLFVIFLALISLTGYSIAGEKFPWLFIPALTLFVFAAGLYWGNNFSKSKLLVRILLILLALFTLYNGIRLNFTHPADTRELATYVQTPNSFRAIESRVKEDCTNNSDCVLIDPQISWPLSWDFRDIGRLDNLDNPQTINSQTKYVFANPDKSDNLSNLGFNSRVVQLRDWWVPPVCGRLDCIERYLNYFITRTIWGPKGGYEIIMFDRK